MCEKKCANKGNIVLITLLTAVGVTATAFVIAKRMKGKGVSFHVEDLFGSCERAAQALDERLHTEYATA